MIISVDKEKSLLYIATKYAERNFAKAIIGGRYDRGAEAWVFPIGSVVEALDSLPPELIEHISDDAKEMYQARKQQIEDIQTIISKQHEYKGKHDFLMAHQHMCYDISERADRFGFFMDVGTGKTVLSLHVISNDLDRKWLVLAPKPTVKNTWFVDQLDFYPDIKMFPLTNNFRKEDYIYLFEKWGIDFNPKKRKSELKALGIKHADVFIMNPELFKLRTKELAKLDITASFYDESVMLKNPSSGNHKAYHAYASKLDRVYLLTGKPAPNGDKDYFGQIKIIDESVFGQSIYKHYDEFFISCGYMGKEKVFDESKRAEFTKRLGKVCLYIPKEACLDLPDETYISRGVELEGEPLKMYTQMAKDGLVTLLDTTIPANTKANVINKLRQLTSGILIKEDDIYYVNNTKLTMLLNELESLGDEPVVIWCHYQADIKRIESALLEQGKTVVTAYSKTKDVDASVKAFQRNEAQYIVAHPKTLKYGINFTGRSMVRNCTYAIYYSYTEDLDNFYQSMHRILRKGQTEKVTLIFLAINDTVDIPTYRTLKKKLDHATFVEELIGVLRGGVQYG